MHTTLSITTIRPLDLFENPLSPHYVALDTYGIDHADYIHLYDKIVILEFVDATIYAMQDKDGTYEVLLNDTMYLSKDLLTIISFAQDFVNSLNY
jgi:hypothetical protein